MSKYNDLFKKLLLEQNDLPQPDSKEYPSSSEAFNDTLDDETDPDKFLTRGIQDTFNAVREHFNSKMTEFADSLNPNAVRSMTLAQLKDKLGKVFKFTKNIQTFAKSKIDSLAQDPSAIMAAFIATDPTKQAAFEELHSNLEELQTAMEEVDGKLAALKGKIDDFVQDIQQADESEINELKSAVAGREQSVEGGQPPSAPRV